MQWQHLNQFINIYLHREFRKASFICCSIVTVKNVIWLMIFLFFKVNIREIIFICSTGKGLVSMKMSDTRPPPFFKKKQPLFYQPLPFYGKNLNPPILKILKTQLSVYVKMLREIWGSVFFKNILLWNSLSLMYISVSKNEICIMYSAYSNLIDVCPIFDLLRNFIWSFWLPIWLIWATNLLFHQPGFSHLITLSTKIILEMQKNFIDLLFF